MKNLAFNIEGIAESQEQREEEEREQRARIEEKRRAMKRVSNFGMGVKREEEEANKKAAEDAKAAKEAADAARDAQAAKDAADAASLPPTIPPPPARRINTPAESARAAATWRRVFRQWKVRRMVRSVSSLQHRPEPEQTLAARVKRLEDAIAEVKEDVKGKGGVGEGEGDGVREVKVQVEELRKSVEVLAGKGRDAEKRMAGMEQVCTIRSVRSWRFFLTFSFISSAFFDCFLFLPH